jgi:hypothetical protein
MANLLKPNLLKLMILTLALTLVASCGKKEEDKSKTAAPVVLTMPADSSDNQAWKMYLVNVAKQNMEGIRNSPYMYYLPVAPQGATPPAPTSGDSAPSVDGDADADASIPTDDEYNRQLDNVSGTVGRGVLPGNMLAFGSPDSGRMATLVIEAFTGVSAGSLKDVRVLFVGKAEDSERVKAAVEPSGATFVFHEAK